MLVQDTTFNFDNDVIIRLLINLHAKLKDSGHIVRIKQCLLLLFYLNLTFTQQAISSLQNNKIAQPMSFPVTSYYRLPINTGFIASLLQCSARITFNSRSWMCVHVQPLTGHLSGVVIRSLPEAWPDGQARLGFPHVLASKADPRCSDDEINPRFQIYRYATTWDCFTLIASFSTVDNGRMGEVFSLHVLADKSTDVNWFMSN